MKDIKKYQKELAKKGLVVYTHEEVFGKLEDQSKEYQRAYKEEIARLNLVRQIRELRLAQKLTQKMVAKRAKMPQSVVARLESGEHGFSLDTLQRIAFVFGKQVQLG
jgi:predicted XRE-type DNA-binding protein